MRRLLILRHAKSDWPAGFDDFERPLAKRGLIAAPLMGQYLRSEHLLPDIAIVSASKRTKQTWALVKPELGEDVPHRYERRIYEAPYEELLQVLREVDGSVRTVLLVGHNPGCEELAASLIGHGDRFAAQRLQQKYPTAGLTVIDFDMETWDCITERSGRLDRFITPAMLGGGPDE